jgi:hypothetical protein
VPDFSEGEGMTDITDRLRAAAHAATPGPWRTGWRKPDGKWLDEVSIICTVDGAVQIAGPDDYDSGGVDYPWNAAYIAAASPDVILALLDELDTLRDEAERLRLRISNDAIRMAAASGEL